MAKKNKWSRPSADKPVDSGAPVVDATTQPPVGENLTPAEIVTSPAVLKERETTFTPPVLPVVTARTETPAVTALPPVERTPVVPLAPAKAPSMMTTSHASQVLHPETKAPPPAGPSLEEQRAKNASGLLTSYTNALLEIQKVAGEHPSAEQQKMNLILYQKIISLLLNSKIEALYAQFLQFMVEQTPTKLMGEDYLFKGMRQVEPSARDRIMFFYMVFRNLHAFKYYGKPWTMHMELIRQRLRNDTLITFLGRTLRK